MSLTAAFLDSTMLTPPTTALANGRAFRKLKSELRPDELRTWSEAEARFDAALAEVESAPVERRLLAFAKAANLGGHLVRERWLDKIETVDRLLEIADQTSVRDEYGDDGLQEIFAGAFGEDAKLSPPEPEPTSPTQERAQSFRSLSDEATELCKKVHTRAGTKEAKAPEDARALIILCAANIPPKKIEWLWPNRFAVGKLSEIVGEPDVGKSQVALAIVAAVTTGGQWPCGEGAAPLGSVIILSAEDDDNDTIVPRLMAAGADLQKVHILKAVRSKNGEGRTTFNLQTDLALLESEIKKIGDVRLIIIDPISSYLGKVDSHRNNEIRAVQAPVMELAARLRVAIITISHLNKGGGATAINRVIGSIAFIAAPRATFLAVRDPDDEERRLFVKIKNNIAGDIAGLAYRLEQRLVTGDILASSIVWGSEKITRTANEILAAAAEIDGSSERSGRDEAEEFLRGVLANGPIPVGQAGGHGIRGQAEQVGISWSTLKRAKRNLGVEAHRKAGTGTGIGKDGYWVWTLPEAPKGTKDPYEAQETNVSPLGEFEPLRENETVPTPSIDIPDSLDRRNPKASR